MFHPGDYIECLVDRGFELTKGAIYKVYGMDPNTSYVELVKNNLGLPGIYECSDFKLNVSCLPAGTQPVLPALPTPGFTPYNSVNIPDNIYDQVQKEISNLNETLTALRKKDGLCPKCGSKGHFHHFALVCSEHGEY